MTAILKMRLYAAGLIVFAGFSFTQQGHAQTPAPAVSAAPAPAAAPATPPATPAQVLTEAQVQLTPSNPAAPVVVPQVKSKIEQMKERFYFLLTGKNPNDPDPTSTLVAPFADETAEPAKAGERNVMRLTTNEVSLDQPHRSAGDLADWLMQAMSETLSFTADDYNEHLKILSRGMNADALAQFNNWITTSGILGSLQSNGLQLNGFVEEKPFLLNEGAVSGRYRWLFEIPVQISFVPRGATTLDKVQGINTKKLIITLQIGRVAESQLIDKVSIESWTVQENNRKN